MAQASSGAVSGHLYCADTHAPCRFGTVSIQSAPPAKADSGPPVHGDGRSYSAATDMDGAFQIGDVPPGDYYILGRFAGYISPYDVLVNESKDTVSLNSPGLGYALNRITVDAGRTTVSDLTMNRGGTLEGVVVYDDGSPAVNLPTHLFRKDAEGHWKFYTNSSGNSSLATLGMSDAQTDDRGRFYYPGLPPGTYTVEASLREYTFLPGTIVGRQSLEVKVTKGDALGVYFGNKYRQREAAAIELRGSEDHSGVDITMAVVGLHTVRGTVTAKADGSSIKHGTVRLLDPEDKTKLRETEIQSGSFLLHYVASGSYLVEVNAAGSKDAGAYEGMTAALLVDGDVDDLAYALPATPH
ncbi:MAG: carboxypeptidase-like regulatory domain-containing protein [Acidobacteriota bacterium]|nr:carboxypeptidase-like regulatory domain-containing protein [Acidobacteriota bacterium]